MIIDYINIGDEVVIKTRE